MKGQATSLYDYSENDRGSSIPNCSECGAEFLLSYIGNTDKLQAKFCPICGGEL